MLNGQVTSEPGFQDYFYSLAAGASVTIPGIGSMVKCLTAASPVELRIQDGTAVSLPQGRKYVMPAGQLFDRIELINPNGSTVGVTISIGYGDVVDDARLDGTIEISVPDTLSDVADVSVTAATTVLVCAANASRKTVIINNLSDNAETMRVGSSSAGAARGVEVAPGEKAVFDTSAAIYAYNPGASAESVAVVEIL